MFCAVVKREEESVDVSVPVASPDIPWYDQYGLTLSERAMFPVRSASNIDFRELVEKNETEHEELTSKSVCFVLAERL